MTDGPIAPPRIVVHDGWPALVWELGPGWRAVSSAILGGGIGERAWVLNAQVRPGYSRMDPVAHLGEIAAPLALPPGAGVGMMTAALVEEFTAAHDGGVAAWVTTGIGVPTWAAAPDPVSEAGDSPHREEAGPAPAAPRSAGGSVPGSDTAPRASVPAHARADPGGQAPDTVLPSPTPPAPAAAPRSSAHGRPSPFPAPGTINILAAIPAPLSDAALVNAVATATEAKVQALFETGYACTGTPSDAVCLVARVPRPGDEAEPFGGPRSVWGARLARAVHGACTEGALADRVRRSAAKGS
ncbi:adenosylcobinamide amidohydrolase [Uniformispora flossi]|uniref:adenosylcobinamide amidohydrolase n=1 Tax=Uniformispora flossi TaxID=3390723 RepID=UPI003C2FCCA2